MQLGHALRTCFTLLHHDSTLVTPLYDRHRFLCLAGSSCNGARKIAFDDPLMNGLFILVLALVCLIWHQAVVVRQALEMECEEMVIFSASTIDGPLISCRKTCLVQSGPKWCNDRREEATGACQARGFVMNHVDLYSINIL